ncbi:MAG: NAD(P)H-hydrate dehydratase [Gemmataceae bacterium]
MTSSPLNPAIVMQVAKLPPRDPDGNKGDYGRILVVAGCRGMSGAAVLCATGALRSGAGLVRLAVPEEILPQVTVGNPCYTTAPLPQDDYGRLAEQAGDDLLALAEADDVMAIGPGIGRSETITKLVLSLLEQARIPVVIDADAINGLRGNAKHLVNRAGPTILTPHPGEFARLLFTDVPTVQSQRQDLAVRFASEHRVVLVLKGHRSIVTDGKQVYINTTGNPGMATGGSGDVLTGIIAALLGQKLSPFEAAQLGVYVHGLAGDLARDVMGEVSLIATDLLDYLPAAFKLAVGG